MARDVQRPDTVDVTETRPTPPDGPDDSAMVSGIECAVNTSRGLAKPKAASATFRRTAVRKPSSA